MSIIEHAKSELAAINFGEEDSAVMIGLLEKFLDQWDSGGAVFCAAPVFVRLLKGQPLAPLTGADDEWFDPMGDGIMLQNKRCGSVFKNWRDANGRLSENAGQGALKIHDIDNPSWDGTFPYDPTTQLPTSPVVEFS
jgi:hypothetical protein